MNDDFIVKTYSVRGMACTGCETIIRNTLLRIEGVGEADPDFAGNTVTVTFNEKKVSVENIRQALKKEGYILEETKDRRVKTGETGRLHRNQDEKTRILTSGTERKTLSPLQFVGIAAVLLAIYLIIRNTVGFTFIPEITASMGYGMLFLIGLLTSLHCVAMCGGISMSQCMPKENSPASAKDKIRPSLLYNLGRVISYTIIGGIVGALGSVFSFSGRARGAAAIAAGIFMVIMGMSMLGIFPWLNKFTPRLPKFLRQKAGNAGKGKGPFIVGLLNGLMPCGPLQAMQIYALGTGSFLSGSLSMFFFSLGTLPLMFGLGVFIMFLGSKFTKWMVGAGAVLVVVLGIVMFSRGAALSGISMPKIVWSNTQSAQVQTAETAVRTNEVLDNKAAANNSGNDVQHITSTLSANAYPDITVQKGIPVEWTIHADKGVINGCNGNMVISAFGIQYKLKTGDNLIKFTPTETGTITYSCWMGMITGQIQVDENTAGSGAQPPAQSDTGYSSVPAESQQEAASARQDTASEQQSAPIGGCCGL